jgi:hypothetical protein
MKTQIRTDRQPEAPTIAQLIANVTNAEITAFRHGITKAAAQEDWQAAAIAFFAGLRRRAAKYEVRKLTTTYNAGL